MGGLRVLYYHYSAYRCGTVMFSALPVVIQMRHGDMGMYIIVCL